jgi:segment polarity protein dishevelled
MILTMIIISFFYVAGPPRINGHSKHHGHSYDSSTVLSSDIDTTSFFDTDDDSRFSTVTDTTNRTASKYGRQRRRQRRKHRMPPISRVCLKFKAVINSKKILDANDSYVKAIQGPSW